MNDEKLLSAIERLGFTENETKCYLVLFKKDSLTASETAKLSGVPRQNTYKALEKLLHKGLIVSIPGDVKRYTASDPKHLKEKPLMELKGSIEEDIKKLENKKKEILETADAIETLGSLYEASRGNGSPLDYIEVLKSPDHIHRKFIQLSSETKNEILAFIKPPFSHVTALQEREQVRAQVEILRKGIKSKAIHEVPNDETEKALFLEKLSDFIVPNENDENRLIENLPMKMVVFDERVVLFALEDPILGKSSLTSLLIRHPSLAKSLKTAFESYWVKAKDSYIVNNRKYYLSKPGSNDNKRSRKSRGE